MPPPRSPPPRAAAAEQHSPHRCAGASRAACSSRPSQPNFSASRGRALTRTKLGNKCGHTYRASAAAWTAPHKWVLIRCRQGATGSVEDAAGKHTTRQLSCAGVWRSANRLLLRRMERQMCGGLHLLRQAGSFAWRPPQPAYSSVGGGVFTSCRRGGARTGGSDEAFAAVCMRLSLTL